MQNKTKQKYECWVDTWRAPRSPWDRVRTTGSTWGSLQVSSDAKLSVNVGWTPQASDETTDAVRDTWLSPHPLQTQGNTQQNVRAECKCRMSPTSLWWNYICRQWYVISSTVSSDAEQYPTELKVPSSWVKIQDELHKPLQPQSVTPDGTTHAIRGTSQASTDAEQHPTELLQMLWDSRTEIKDISGSS